MVGRVLTGRLSGEGLSVAVVCSRFNDLVVERLLSGALDALRRHGVEDHAIDVAWVPGAFELPLVASRLAATGRYDAVVALGAVIRGETSHFDLVAGQCASGIQRAQLDSGVPIAFGVLTSEDLGQALERAGGKAGNKGYDAAVSAMEMADLLAQVDKPDEPGGRS